MLRGLGRTVTPTYGFERNDDLWPQLASLAESFDQGFCFRVSIDDLDDRSEETWVQIIERSAVLGLQPSKIDILIDLRYIGESNDNELKELVLDFFAVNPGAAKYRSFILAGSCAAKTVAHVKQDDIGDVLRKELGVWSELRQDVAPSLHVVFGDYGVIHPDFSDLPQNPRITQKIVTCNTNSYKKFNKNNEV